MKSIIDKEREIISKLEETGYEMFDGDKEEAMDFISSKVETFPHYANVVINEQIMTPIWRARYEGQELRDKIESIDATRRYAHESAIGAVTALNRFCKNLGLEPFADIDTNDRHAVAEFVGKAVNEVYNAGINNGNNAFDAATYQKDKVYDEKRMKEELNKLDKNYAAIQNSSDYQNDCQME